MSIVMQGSYKVLSVNLSQNGKYYVVLGDPNTFEKFTFIFENLPAGVAEGGSIEVKPTPIEMKEGKFGATFKMKGGEK